MIKKTKLTISGIAKKSIENIELAKTQSKNSVVIEKKNNKFSGKSSFIFRYSIDLQLINENKIKKKT